MRIIVDKMAPLVVALAAVLTLAACGSTASTTSPTAVVAGADGSPISVVTSTNVWGDVVTQVGGDQVAVTPLIADPAADPHSFEPTAQAQLALSKAALVIENGGGYDDFVQTMVDAAGVTAPVITAVEFAGTEAAGATPSPADAAGGGGTEPGEFNEHVWYDFEAVGNVAAEVADTLSSIRPAKAAFFQDNLAAFTDKLAGLMSKLDEIKAAHDGAPVAITEPVPLYLTEAAGLQNLTPPAFSAAIEEGTGVPPLVLTQTLALFSDKSVVALVYNEQTASPETEQVLAAARDNSIATVGVTETLPEGKDYLSWMDANIAALQAALG